MFLNAGAKYEKERCGYTLLVCPICHSVRVFAAYRLRRFHHFYHLPLTEGRLLEGFVLCQECGVRLTVKSVAVESLHQSSDKATLWELLLPAAQARLLERAEAELELLKSRGRDSEERRAGLRRSLLAVEDELASLCEGGYIHSSPRSLRGIAFGTFVVGGLLVGGALFSEPSLLGMLLAMLGGGLITFGGLLAYQSLPRHHISRVLLPRVARGLRPYAPTKEELLELQRELRAEGRAVTRYHLLPRLVSDHDASRPLGEWDRLDNTGI